MRDHVRICGNPGRATGRGDPVTILCGFDADHPGDAAAAQMVALHPTVRRLRPPAHDWNDVLTSCR